MAAVRHLEMEVERVSDQNLLAIALRNICAKGDICTMILSQKSLTLSKKEQCIYIKLIPSSEFNMAAISHLGFDNIGK